MALEGLCIVLRRMSYPNRLLDLVAEFGRGRAELSIIFNQTWQFILDNWGHLLTDLDPAWLIEEVLDGSCAAIGALCPPAKPVGFIDGTARAMCRPSAGQRLVYSGHK